MDLRPSGPKRNHKKGIAFSLKEAKRERAKMRQSEYDKLTIDEKIAKLDSSGHKATKQRAKLAAKKSSDIIKPVVSGVR